MRSGASTLDADGTGGASTDVADRLLPVTWPPEMVGTAGRGGRYYTKYVRCSRRSLDPGRRFQWETFRATS